MTLRRPLVAPEKLGEGRDKTDVSSAAVYSCLFYTTENMYFLKFNVKCTVRISNRHLPSFLPSLHSSF